MLQPNIATTIASAIHAALNDKTDNDNRRRGKKIEENKVGEVDIFTVHTHSDTHMYIYHKRHHKFKLGFEVCSLVNSGSPFSCSLAMSTAL